MIKASRKNSLLIQMVNRKFSNRVIKYKGQSLNITSHNPELRSELNVDKTFLNTFNAGYESFSSSWKL